MKQRNHSEPAKDESALTPVVSHIPTVKGNREKKRKLLGWRFGVACSAWVSLIVLLLNLILAVYTAKSFSVHDGVGTAYSGRCDKVDTWATLLHVLINALSSILLTASNYTMQCLCSPTRKEVDQAHARGDWMDIGVASVRNIFKVRWQRRALWWTLALSSVPIHLLYNSVVFKALPANDYYMVGLSGLQNFPRFHELTNPPMFTKALVTTDFLKGGTYSINNTNFYANDHSEERLKSMQLSFSSATENGTTMAKHQVANLSNSDCIAAYGTDYVSQYYNVLAITDQGNYTNDTVFMGEYMTYAVGSDLYYWICYDTLDMGSCDVRRARKYATQWTITGRKIEYCLAELLNRV